MGKVHRVVGRPSRQQAPRLGHPIFNNRKRGRIAQVPPKYRSLRHCDLPLLSWVMPQPSPKLKQVPAEMPSHVLNRQLHRRSHPRRKRRRYPSTSPNNLRPHLPCRKGLTMSLRLCPSPPTPLCVGPNLLNICPRQLAVRIVSALPSCPLLQQTQVPATKSQDILLRGPLSNQGGRVPRQAVGARQLRGTSSRI